MFWTVHGWWEFETAVALGEIYYLAGMGGRLDAGLGEELLRR